MTTEEPVFPSEVFVEQVTFSRLPSGTEPRRRGEKVIWSRRVLAAVAVAGSVVSFTPTPRLVSASPAVIVANQSPSDPLSEEDIEDRIDAAQLSRSYGTNRVRGLSRYREYQEKRFGRKV